MKDFGNMAMASKCLDFSWKESKSFIYKLKQIQRSILATFKILLIANRW